MQCWNWISLYVLPFAASKNKNNFFSILLVKLKSANLFYLSWAKINPFLPKVCSCVAERPLGSNELSFHLEPVDEDRVDVVAVGVALQRKCFTDLRPISPSFYEQLLRQQIIVDLSGAPRASSTKVEWIDKVGRSFVAKTDCAYTPMGWWNWPLIIMPFGN